MASLPSADQNRYAYQAFLSFRGEDTRSSFTDHLYEALCERGIETFRDDDELRKGEKLSAALFKAIEESRVSIIVFSENYASSRWCLDELVKILECRKSKGQDVRSVFYKVDPSDVRHQTGSVGEAFAKLNQYRYKDSMHKWRAALKEAADLPGWTFKKGEYEAAFINKIVGELSAVVNSSYELPVAEHPVGIESCKREILRLLDVEDENSVRMVGIWGLGGIGKTTIAKVLYNSIRPKFEGSSFLADVRAISSLHQGLAQLQQTLLSGILRDPTLKVHNVDEGISFIKERLRQKKVLVILDDVSDSNQLKKLAPSSDYFGAGSRIIVTTRDRRCLTDHQVDSIYEVKMLDDDRALELFSWKAFRRNGPPDDYLKLAQHAVRYAQGLPLALMVLGSRLFDRICDKWEAILDSCKRDPQIQGVFSISYDALDYRAQKLLLQIAGFFNGKNVVDVTPILQAGSHYAAISMQLLVEKALIRIDEGKIWMHNLIEEMGKDLLLQEGENEKAKGEHGRSLPTSGNSFPMEMIEKEAESVFVTVDFNRNGSQYHGALYEIKLEQLKPRENGKFVGGASVEPSTLPVLNPVLKFFAESWKMPVDCTSFDCARFGSCSKLYLMVNDISWPYLKPIRPKHAFFFDTANKLNSDLEQISPPKTTKQFCVVISAYGMLYYLAQPICFPCIQEPSFERYDPTNDSWESLPSYPGYFLDQAESQITGYAVCYGYILISMADESGCQVVAFHIDSKKWHKVRVCSTEDYYYPFWGRAVVVDNIIYAMSCNLCDVLAFSFWWDSDESTGRRHYLGTPISMILLAQAYPPSQLLTGTSQNLVHLGRRDFCLVETGRNWHSLEYQYLCVTTFRIVGQGREMDIETLRSSVYRVAIEGMGEFAVKFSFAPHCQDIEPKEEDYSATTKLTESESAARNLEDKEDFFSFPTGPKLGLEAFCSPCS